MKMEPHGTTHRSTHIKPKTIRTGSQVWGDYIALRYSGLPRSEWRFLVRIHGVACCVVLHRNGGTVHRAESTEELGEIVAKDDFLAQIKHGAKCEQIALRLLERADAALSPLADVRS